eukprot:gene16853-34987_t
MRKHPERDDQGHQDQEARQQPTAQGSHQSALVAGAAAGVGAGAGAAAEAAGAAGAASPPAEAGALSAAGTLGATPPLKSVAYQPVPLSWKPAAVSCFLNEGLPHDRQTVSTGSEIVCDYAMLGGAHGIVPGLGNVDPAGYVRLYDAARRGDWTAARAEQERLIALFQIVFQGVPQTSPNASGVGGFKTAMQLMGLIPHRHMSRPNKPLSDEQADRRIALTGTGNAQGNMVMPDATLVLDVRDLSTRFATPHGEIKAVNGIRFQVRRGETLALVGESGSGKSVT